MVAPSYATNLTDITLAESTTGWGAFGGGGAGLSASPDLAVEGTNCVDKQVSGADRGMMYGTGAGVTFGADEHVYIWLFCGTPGLIDTYANNGLYLAIGDSTSAFVKFHMTGSDQFQLDETVKCWVVRYVNTTNGSAPQRTLVGSPGTTPSDFGGGLNTTASVKGANIGLDALRRGHSVSITDGDSGTPATWIDTADHANDSTRRWGIIQPSGAGVGVQGLIQWGTSGTSCYARDSDSSVLLLDVPHALSSLQAIEFNNASTDVDFDNVGVVAGGTTSRGTITVNNNATVVWTNSVFQGIDTTTLGGTNSTFDGSTWTGCNGITNPGGSMVGASVIAPTIAADASAVDWDVNQDPDGELDDMTFEMGANAHHAVDFGANTPTNITLRGWTVTGFSAANGNNDSVIHNTSGKAITVNVVGNTGTISYKNTGAGSSTTIVANPVTLAVNCQDVDTMANLQNVRVYVEAAAGGPLATGTVILNALTDVNGDASDTRAYASNQPITGWARRATSGFGTLYKQSNIAGSINSSTGRDISIQMVPDE